MSYAQRTTGDLLGVVRDASGAVLPGVSVSVTGPNIVGAQTTTTTENGSYRIGNLPPGTYTVTYELSGFKTIVMQGLRVAVGGTLEQNVGLEIGALAESVTVTGETPVVDTTSSEVGTTFDKDWVANAPSRRFGFYDLLAQAPGSVKGGDGTAASERRTMSFGSSFDENAFQLDGVNVTDNYFSEGFSEPNPDAIDEVEVLALGAPAEYGNLMGAVYNIVTKQGTNQFHGDASGFFQSNGLSSNNTKDIMFPNGKFADACSDDPNDRCPWTRGDYYEATAQLGGPIRTRQALVLRVVRTPEGRVDELRRELQPSGQRERHHEGSNSREGDLADDADPAARRQLPPRQVAQGRGLQLQRDAVDGVDADPDGADARPGVHGDALEPDAAGHPLLRVLRWRDRLSVRSQ